MTDTDRKIREFMKVSRPVIGDGTGFMNELARKIALLDDSVNAETERNVRKEEQLRRLDRKLSELRKFNAMHAFISSISGIAACLVLFIFVSGLLSVLPEDLFRSFLTFIRYRG